MNFTSNATDLPAEAPATGRPTNESHQVRPPITHPYHRAIIDEIMNHITHYVKGENITEDEANNLEFYYETFVLEKRPCFTTLVLSIIYKHHTKYSYPPIHSYFNRYQEMYDDVDYIESVTTSALHMYHHLPEYIVELCRAFERLYGQRHKKIIHILTFMEQIEDKVSPNLNQVIVNKDLGRYLMEFIN
jgi:hypothetical protein